MCPALACEVANQHAYSGTLNVDTAAQLLAAGEPASTVSVIASAAQGEAAQSTDHARGLSIRSGLRSALQRWAYVAEDGRDLRIDFLRGLAVLAMVVDHIAGPSKLYLLTAATTFTRRQLKVSSFCRDSQSASSIGGLPRARAW